MGHVRTRSGGALPGISPSNTYPTRDGSYVVIAGSSDAIFKRLMIAIGRQELAVDEELATNDRRVLRDAELDAAISEWTLRHTIAEALDALDVAGVPAGRIYSVADIVDDPHYRAREMIIPAELPGNISVKMPGIVPKLSGTPGVVRWSGPRLGEHTCSVLEELGKTEQEVQDLRARGIIQ
jgi:crotonobetainyl-CoA:carnitine CoA-transferase CaiB-like acyl-CoA transferase